MQKRNGLHVAIIPDGNRRWAKKQGLMAWKGHERARSTLRSVIDWSRSDPRVTVLSIWIFSTENWQRSEEEVQKIFQMFESFLREDRQTFIERSTRVLHSGRKDRLPTALANLLQDVSTETAGFTDFTLNVCLDYGGKDEIVRSIQKLNSTGTPVSEESIRTQLDHPELPDIDLIIRTSGEKRMSNFALWQGAYAEWIFSERLFPDFKPEDLDAALQEFEDRQRRFGS